jgi:hypothetical protein
MRYCIKKRFKMVLGYVESGISITKSIQIVFGANGKTLAYLRFNTQQKLALKKTKLTFMITQDHKEISEYFTGTKYELNF